MTSRAAIDPVRADFGEYAAAPVVPPSVATMLPGYSVWEPTWITPRVRLFVCSRGLW